MTDLHKLPALKGSTHRRKLLGRGRSSGHGKTSGRGMNGQHCRAGSRFRPGFESGHIPLYRRLPRRGFNNAAFKKVFATVNLSSIEERFEANAVVDAESLVKAGLIRKATDTVKVLGSGEISKALTFKVAATTASAKVKIEKAGGKVELIEAKKPEETTEE